MNEIRYNLFHTTTITRYGLRHQVEKFIEEADELVEALRETDREHIVEELADVELTLPYIIKPYLNYSSMSVKSLGVRMSIEDSTELIKLCVKLRMKHGSVRSLFTLLQQAVNYYVLSLSMIYEEHLISNEEVQDWKEEKMRRTLKRMIGVYN